VRFASAALAGAALAFAGCQRADDAVRVPADAEVGAQLAQSTSAAPTGTLTAETWRLVAIRRPGAAQEPVGPEPTYTVQFGADGRYSGRAHCNSFTGGYESAAPGELIVRAGAATLAACPMPSIADEFLRALASVSRYRFSGEELRLIYNTSGELKFVRAAQQAVAVPEAGQTFVYDCDGDVRFTVRTGADEVALWAPASLGATYQVLSRVRTASGAQYREGDTLYWSKGDLATIEHGGQRFVDCRSNPREVPWADAKRRGATFRGLGQEPGWFVELFPDRLALVTDYGTNRTEAKHSGPILDDAGRTMYRTAEGREVTIGIERQACADSMSGEPFEAAVTASFDNRTLKGCGRFL